MGHILLRSRDDVDDVVDKDVDAKNKLKGLFRKNEALSKITFFLLKRFSVNTFQKKRGVRESVCVRESECACERKRERLRMCECERERKA